MKSPQLQDDTFRPSTMQGTILPTLTTRKDKPNKVFKKILIGFTALIVIASATYYAIAFINKRRIQEPIRVYDAFINDLRNDDVEGAYQLLSLTLQQTLPKEQLIYAIGQPTMQKILESEYRIT